MQINQNLNKLAAILLAKSINDLNSDLLFGDCILTEEGFGYSFKLSSSLSTKDFPKILKQMRKNIDRAYELKYEDITKEEARRIFANQPYKLELVEHKEKIAVIHFGNDYVDLCEPLGINKLSDLKAFDLLNVAGIYWNGNANNEQLTAVYGVAFSDNKELETFKLMLIERKERDHRKIGADLELFTFNILAGQGLPIWLPNGTTIKYEIEKFIHDLLVLNGYMFVQTPILGSKELYITSGHWNHYRENMFSPIDVDGEILILRPMTCPHHLLIYKERVRSYRELPFRLAEHAILHRYEASGALTGLERVRSMQLVDTHLVCEYSQIEQEVKRSYEIIKKAHEALGTTIHAVDLSLHDPRNKEKFFDNEEMWKSAEDQLRAALASLKIPYREVAGEAAFYGPKIDLQVKTTLGHVITVSTIQLDFLLPDRFKLEYKAANGEMKRPILIHAGIIGTFERYMSILLEQNKGVFPLWLAAQQVAILPVEPEKHADYCKKIERTLIEAKIRAVADFSDERLSKRIRDAQVKKIPYQLIIGDNEIEKDNVSYREYGQQETHTLKLDEFLKLLQTRIQERK